MKYALIITAFCAAVLLGLFVAAKDEKPNSNKYILKSEVQQWVNLKIDTVLQLQRKALDILKTPRAVEFQTDLVIAFTELANLWTDTPKNLYAK